MQDTERTPLQQMSDYMNAHNYGKDDYAEYSQDPEWQRLNNALLQEEDIPPTAFQQMGEYMNEHNYGRDDYAEYSQDPEWQRLNDAMLEDPDMPVPVTPYEDRIDAVLPDAEGETAEFQETQELNPPNDTDGETEGVSDWMDQAAADSSPEMEAETAELPEKPEGDLDQLMNEVPEDPGIEGLMDEVPADPAAEQELREIPETEETAELPEGFYSQGNNDLGFEGTCGPTSIANGVNRILGTNQFSENDVLNEAVNEGLCSVDPDFPQDSGGTTTEEFVDLYEHMNEMSGGQLQIDKYDFDDVLNMEQVADKLDEGCVVHMAVDADTLWGQSSAGMLGTPQIDKSTDHWITVTNTCRDADGTITGFDVIDSGGGVDHVDADTFQTMCYGSENLHLDDPTCIVVGKKDGVDLPGAETAEPLGPETAEMPQPETLETLETPEMPPSPEVSETMENLQEQSSFFREMSPEQLRAAGEGLNSFNDHEREVYLEAMKAEPELTRDVKEICEQTGSVATGLENRLKSPDSLLDKVYHRDVSTEIDDIKDINRYTQVFEPEEMADGVNNSLALFEEKGYHVDEIKDKWSDDSDPYKGINVKLTSPDGRPLEVQYHTQESYEVKNGEMHDLYCQWRDLFPDSPQALQLSEEMRKLSDPLKKPPGLEGVRKQ